MLLGIQLDDEVLLDGQVDIALLGHAHDLGHQVVPVILQPLGRLTESIGFHILLQLLQVPAALGDGDHHAGLHQEGGDIADDSMKWYEWESDMLTLSSEFPEMEFVLYGEGEERDDNWRAFFKNGECVYQQAHMYYDPEPVFKE